MDCPVLTSHVGTAESISSLSQLTSISLRGNPLQRLPVLHIGSLQRFASSFDHSPVIFGSKSDISVGFRSLSALILDDPGPELIVPAKEVSRKGGQAVLEYSRRIAVGWREGRLEGARLGLKGLPIEVSA